MNNYANTPLRYPGGKSVLTDYFILFISSNSLQLPYYAEPYCGGAGSAINLLLANKVEKLLLNDADKAIYSFWYSIKHQFNAFLELFDNVAVTLEEWHLQKKIYDECKHHINVDFLSLGFATFFLNRCNRSGILTAGPIGGNSIISQENANYKIDARFKKHNLREKLINLNRISEKVEIYNLDAINFIRFIINKQPIEDQLKTFVYLDPPYYSQGSSLYLNNYSNKDHEELFEFLKSSDNLFKWLLSYDNVSSIKHLYKEFDTYSFYLNYSAQNNKLGSELLIKSKNSILPETNVIKVLKNKKEIELIEVNY
jgi:DNA adenine methylase